ncbi:amino acid adenylation domain-containing protein [Saccharothrix australiensis]|uniref:Amino acid adenylation domain-containing protein n=1 Tax=Saccharothrix australiensis TaxID=2072 RepID=A0A495VXT4_9PSEU|nr:amino acid adenylation domain-containing protein [Saccharothrix australiensis]RKT54241.1 amino acid adenylation domain-containing protein [Saccharothrix australiensis]
MTTHVPPATPVGDPLPAVDRTTRDTTKHLHAVHVRVPPPPGDDLAAVVAVVAALVAGYRGDDTIVLACPDPDPRATGLRLVRCAPDLDAPFGELAGAVGAALAVAPRVAPRDWADATWLCLPEVSRSVDGWDVEIRYDGRRWEPTVAERAFARSAEVAASVRRSTPRRAIGVPTAADLRLIAEVNDTAAPFDGEVRLDGLFDRRARHAPDAPALVHDGGVLTYRDLDERVERLAHALRERGVGPGDVVGVLLRRGVPSITAIMAVLRVGAAYLPLDPANPPGRTHHILTDARARLLLTDGDVVPPASCAVLDPATADSTATGDPRPGRGSGDPAYVIYTSGSTGRPKGVVVGHRAVVNRLSWMQRAYPIGVDDVLLHKTPVSFDVSVWELFWWTAHGASLCLLAPGGEKDPAAITTAIGRHGVTVVHFVPSMLDAFLDHVDRVRPLAQLRSLRTVFTSGEALTPEQVGRFHRLLAEETGARLVNLYGPTEATVDVSHFPCVEPEPHRVPIGRPIDNTRLYVLDDRLAVRPVGAVGELGIAGVCLAAGYLDRPALTAERFPADVAGEERVYLTGDLARLLPSGEFEYLGRVDHQVKIRGMRVEPGEVEAMLREHDDVGDAVVVPFRHAGGGDKLCGFVTLSRPVRVAELKRFLRARLPEHMVPTCFAAVESFPLSANGKLDRKALPPVDLARFARSEDVAFADPAAPDARR